MDNYTRTYHYTGGQTTNLSATFAKLMRSVYIWLCAGLAITGLTALVMAKNSELVMAIATNRLLFWGLMLAELGLVIYLSARIMKMSFLTASLSFAAYSLLNGVTMSFIFFVYTMSSIAQTFFITAGTFGAMAVVGFFIKKDLSTMGRALMMLLIGLIIASVVNIFMHSSGLALILNYLGVFIFTALTAYDSQKIKNMLIEASQYGITDQTQKIALMGSLALYLDFINLFLYLLRIFGDRK